MTENTKQAEIDKLNHAVTQITGQCNELRTENKKLQKYVETLELRNAQLIHQRDEITKRRDELVRPYEEMREKLWNMENNGFHIDLD